MAVDLGKVGHIVAGATSYTDRGLEESMPWYAQRAGLPDTHRHHADEGGELARVYERLGYVKVPAPGAGEPEETGLEPVEQVVVEELAAVEETGEQAVAVKPKRGSDA